MIALGVLHHLSWHWNVLAWLIGFLLLVIGVLAALLITTALRPKRGSSLARTLFAFGPAAFVPPLTVLALRVFERIEPSIGPGPQHWLIGWVPGMSGAFVHPYDTLVAMHVLSAAGTAFAAILAALFFPPSPSRQWTPPLPGRWIAAGLLMTTAVVFPFFAFRVYIVDHDAARLLDLLGMMPVFGIAVALRANAYLPPPPLPVAARAPVAPERAIPDLRKAWISAGLLDAEAKPLERIASREDTSDISPRSASAWAAIEGPGRPPQALDELLAALPTSHELFVLGDLPSETEHSLLAALFVDLIGTAGMRVLLVHPEPQRLIKAYTDGLVRARTWEPGAAVSGVDALHEAVAGHQLPSLAAMTVRDFAEHLIPRLSHETGTWARGLDLLVVHRPDLGTPIEVTHTAFAWRRWHLATQRTVKPAVLVTVPDAPAHRAFAERLFPQREGRRIVYRARSIASATAWPGREPAPGANVPWLSRAAKVVTDLDVGVSAIDPAGRWSRDLMPPDATLVREARWNNPASVAEFAPGDLVESVGSLANRLPAPIDHQSLWSLPSEPIARFLHPLRLAALRREGRLPRPAPILGDRNRFVRLAHLDVALREAATDEHSLRMAFGNDLVDFRLRTSTEPARRAETHTAWREGGEIRRSPHLQGSSTLARSPSSQTVTSEVVQVIEQRSGEVLHWVDARTAQTRLYPKRVFSVGTRQYMVPMHAFDAKRNQLQVTVASERDRTTCPVMSFEVAVRHLTVERVTRRDGAFTVHTLSAECLVTEKVHAAWVPSLDQEERFEAVESTYDTELRFIFPEKATKGLGLFHLAAVVESILPVFLRCGTADVAVTPVRAGLIEGRGPGIAVVDRLIGGMGVAAALDDVTVTEILTWARTMLYECACMDGCKVCTPAIVLRVGGAKQEVLRVLEGL